MAGSARLLACHSDVLRNFVNHLPWTKIWNIPWSRITSAIFTARYSYCVARAARAHHQSSSLSSYRTGQLLTNRFEIKLKVLRRGPSRVLKTLADSCEYCSVDCILRNEKSGFYAIEYFLGLFKACHLIKHETDLSYKRVITRVDEAGWVMRNSRLDAGQRGHQDTFHPIPIIMRIGEQNKKMFSSQIALRPRRDQKRCPFQGQKQAHNAANRRSISCSA